MSRTEHPLAGPPPDDDPWVRVGRIRVIAEVQFGEVLSIAGAVPAFQDQIRGEYPVLETLPSEVRGRGEGGEESEGRLRVREWRFSDRARVSMVSLSAGRLSLDTSEFAGRADFRHRIRDLLAALGRSVRPDVVVRIGVRAVDRLAGRDVEFLRAAVRDDLLGLSGPLPAAEVRMSITHQQCELPEEGAWLSARWGLLPEGATMDPEAIEPLADPSWILDLDAFSTDEAEFDVGAIDGKVGALIDRLQVVSTAIGSEAFRVNRVYDGPEDPPILVRSESPTYAGAPSPSESNGEDHRDRADGASVVHDADAGVTNAPAAASGAHRDPLEPPPDTRPPCLKALMELRLTAGLTFDQAARLLGVSVRAVFQWVSRQRMSASNEERLMRTLAVLRHADRGDAQSTRAALLQAAPDGRVPFDLIAEGKLDEARELLGKGPGRKWLPYWPLSREEQEKRKPLSPWILMNARDDVVHEEIGRGRAAKAYRGKRRGSK